jgi:hypothetical protein
LDHTYRLSALDQVDAKFPALFFHIKKPNESLATIQIGEKRYFSAF